MAVTHHKSSTTIRGITYNYGDAFKCYASYGGATTSEGSGSASDLTKGTTYYYAGYATGDSGNVTYPYAVSITSKGEVRGWYKENVFPYATYTIKYNANGGSGAPSSQTKTHGTNLTLSSTKPTRTGYTFKAWALTKEDADNGTWYYQAGSTCGKNENLTLYAVWQENKLTVNYYSNYATSYNGTYTPENTVNNNNVLVYTADFAYDNAYSSGLHNYDSGSSIGMIRTGYTITGNWGTSTSGGTLVHQNTSFTTGQELAKALGKDLSSGNASVNVYAQWQENALTINYYSNYADYCTFNGETISVGKDKNVIVYTHKYYYDNAYNDGIYNIQNSEKLYLSRTGYTSTLHWGTSTNGGTLIDQYTSFSTGQAIAEALGKSLKNGNVTVNLYPQWKVNTYKFNFNSNGGVGTMNNQNVNWNETFVISNNNFKREGYKFVGWNAYRDDGTWFVNDGGWQSEANILANNYTKKVYNSVDELLFNESWIQGNKNTKEFVMYALWEISGVVYIDDETSFRPYHVYVDNGTSWDLYLAYVDNGTSWDIIS